MATRTIKIEVDKKVRICDYCSKEKANQKCDCCDKDICRFHRGYKYPYDDNEELKGILCVECWKKFPKFAQDEIERIIGYLNNCYPEDISDMLRPEFFMQKGFYLFSNARDSDSFIVRYYEELKEEDIGEIESGPEYDRDRYEYIIYDETGEIFEIDKSLKLI